MDEMVFVVKSAWHEGFYGYYRQRWRAEKKKARLKKKGIMTIVREVSLTEVPALYNVM